MRISAVLILFNLLLFKESKCKVRKLTNGAKRESRETANKDNEII